MPFNTIIKLHKHRIFGHGMSFFPVVTAEILSVARRLQRSALKVFFFRASVGLYSSLCSNSHVMCTNVGLIYSESSFSAVAF